MSARRARTIPRKRPKQERSEATVDAILQAAAYILVRHGWEGLNTNRIAERAGVNIASLYQYFPNKEAIVIELQRRHISKAREAFPRAVPLLRNQRSAKVMLELVVRAAVDEHRITPALHRVFAEELPRSARRVVQADEQEYANNWRAILEPFARNLPSLDLAAFVVRVALHAVVHEAAAERPELLDHPDFVTEVVTLLERYLRRPSRDT